MSLRNDVQPMEEAELEGWIETMLRTMHKADLQIIHKRLELALKQDTEAMIRGRRYKMCDKCMHTFPFHIVHCPTCGNEELRTFAPPQ